MQWHEREGRDVIAFVGTRIGYEMPTPWGTCTPEALKGYKLAVYDVSRGVRGPVHERMRILVDCEFRFGPMCWDPALGAPQLVLATRERDHCPSFLRLHPCGTWHPKSLEEHHVPLLAAHAAPTELIQGQNLLHPAESVVSPPATGPWAILRALAAALGGALVLGALVAWRRNST